MIKRELKDFEWRYDAGEVRLIDKRENGRGEYDVVNLPMSAVDSLMRALITFKTRHRIDLVRKARSKKK